MRFAVFVHLNKTRCGITVLTYLCAVLHLFFHAVSRFSDPLMTPSLSDVARYVHPRIVAGNIARNFSKVER